MGAEWKPKLVITCRHGSYARGRTPSEEKLTGYGKIQSERLAEAIREMVKDSLPVVLTTSDAPRAQETAKTIAARLGVEPVVLPILQEDRGRGKRQAEEISKVSSNATSVVAVTHFESPSTIIDAFSSKYCGEGFAIDEIDKGQGLVLDTETGEIKQFPRA